MESAASSRAVFKFGLFDADVSRNELTRDGVRVKIQDQPFRVLVLLLERPGEVVTREELRQKLWPEGTYVDFDGSLNVILKKLRAAIDDDSDNPRFVETIPRRGYRFIAPVSFRNGAAGAPASDGYARTDREIKNPESATLVQTQGQRSRKSRAFALAAGSALLVLSLIGAARLARLKPPLPSPSILPPHRGNIPMRRSIAVLSFHNVSGRSEDAWLGTAVSEMLRTELAGGEKLRLVSGEDVAKLRISAPWPQTDTFDPKTTARIGVALNSDLLVVGSYTVVGSVPKTELRVDARLQDARSGEILSEVAEIGGSEDLFRIVSRVGAALRDRLGVPALAEADEAGVLASVPLDPDAARFYSLGLAKLRRSDAYAAKDLLQQATQADPKFALAHAMLARAYSQLGYEQKRREEAKKAWDLSTDLPRAERMLVEGDYYESLADHEKAASIYHALFELFPDNVDYGLQLASVQILEGQGSEAVETLKRLRELPPPASGDPRIDLAESRALPNDKPASLLLIRDALRKATAQGNRLVFAQALKEECLNLLYGDHPEQAYAPCQDAYSIFLAAGNRLGAADSLRLMADTQGTEGHYEQAIATYQRALHILQQLGEYEKTGAVLNNMAINFENEGRLDRAEQFYREAQSDFDKAGDRANSCTALGNIGDVLFLRGDLSGAEKLYEQTLDGLASFQPAASGYLLYRLGDLELTEGRVQDAHRRAEQAVKVIRPEQGSYQYLTGAMIVLGETMQALGDLQDARQEYQQTLDIRQKTGEGGLVAESQAELAGVALDEGRPDQAEMLLRPAIAKFEKENGDPDAAGAYILLSRALVAEGKLDEARTAIQRATELEHGDLNPALRLPLEIQQARIEIADGSQGKRGRLALSLPRQHLRSTIVRARKLGYYRIECDARLALGQLEMKEQPPSGRAQLIALASEARGHGLELLARQAEQSLIAASAASHK